MFRDIVFLVLFLVLFLGRETSCWRFVGEDESVIQWNNFENGYEHCVHIVVGSGWGGVYGAWRLAKGGIWDPSQICIFEAEKRVGGRALSVTDFGEGHLSGLSFDMIAYRYQGTHFFVKSVVDSLSLGHVCFYGVGSPECQDESTAMYMVDDGSGNNAGYVTPIIGMLQELIQGGMHKVYGYHQLVETKDEGKLLRFHIRDSQEQKIVLEPKGDVFLNLPKDALLGLEGDFSSLSALSPLSIALRQSQSFPMAKQFAVYKDAFWVSTFDQCTAALTDSEVDPPLSGRYIVGDVVLPCSTTNPVVSSTSSNSSRHRRDDNFVNYCRVASEGLCSPDIQEAEGSLETYYAGPKSYFVDALGDIDDVVVFGTREHNRHLLDDIHQSLMTFYGLSPSSVDLPVFTGIMSVNSNRYPGIAALEFLISTNTFQTENTIMNPFPSNRMFLANAAWGGGASGWAEASLQLVERVLRKYYNLGPLVGGDIPGCYYNAEVCFELGVENCIEPCSVGEELKWQKNREKMREEALKLVRER